MNFRWYNRILVRIIYGHSSVYFLCKIDVNRIEWIFDFSIGAGMSLPYWDFTGSTLVTSNYIRLTADIQSRSGAIWNSVV